MWTFEFGFGFGFGECLDCQLLNTDISAHLNAAHGWFTARVQNFRVNVKLKWRKEKKRSEGVKVIKRWGWRRKNLVVHLFLSLSLSLALCVWVLVCLVFKSVLSVKNFKSAESRISAVGFSKYNLGTRIVKSRKSRFKRERETENYSTSHFHIFTVRREDQSCHMRN